MGILPRLFERLSRRGGAYRQEAEDCQAQPKCVSLCGNGRLSLRESRQTDTLAEVKLRKEARRDYNARRSLEAHGLPQAAVKRIIEPLTGCFVPEFPAGNQDSRRPRKVVVLGSTGSIGTNCLDVVAHLGDRLSLSGLSAHCNCCLPAPGSYLETTGSPRWFPIPKWTWS